MKPEMKLRKLSFAVDGLKFAVMYLGREAAKMRIILEKLEKVI